MAWKVDDIIQHIRIEGQERILDALRRTGDEGSDAFQRIQQNIERVRSQPIDQLAQSTDTAADSAGNLADKTDSLETKFQGMLPVITRLAGALGIMFGIRQIVEYTSAWSDLNGRVINATDSHEEAAEVMERLRVIARNTYSSLETTTEGWLRNTNVLQEAGYTINQTLDFTEALNDAIVVSGARSQQAASLVFNLSQAMALGGLRGQQLTAIMERGGRVAELLAEELGTTRTGLRELGREGEITGKVIFNALTKNMETLRAEAERMPGTIMDGILILGDAFGQLIFRFDQVIGSSEWLGERLLWLADNIEIVGAAVSGLGPILIAVFGPMMLRMVLMFFTAIARHPFIALAIVLVQVITYLIQMRDEWEWVGEAIDRATAKMSRFIDWMGRAIDRAKQLIQWLKGIGTSQQTQSRAGGGYIDGPGTDTSDNIRAWLSPGEYVVRAAAVRHYGVRFFELLNRIALPNLFDNYSTGGYVARENMRFAEGGLVGGGTEPFAVVNLTVGTERFEGLLAPRTVADKLIQYSNTEQVSSGGRKPGWYR